MSTASQSGARRIGVEKAVAVYTTGNGSHALEFGADESLRERLEGLQNATHGVNSRVSENGHALKGALPLAKDLADDAKENAEHLMLVDLGRNDLGRVAAVGSVTVPELLTVVGAPGVWHLVSVVRAELSDDVGNDALLDATFPPASVTGTPKIRAAELIGQWEPLPRGVYCGAVGMAGPDHALDLSVAIRTVEIDADGAMRLGVGGGITIDSDVDREWQECLDKAAAIIGAVGGTVRP